MFFLKKNEEEEAAADTKSGAAVSSEWKLVESEEQLDLLFAPSVTHTTNTNHPPPPTLTPVPAAAFHCWKARWPLIGSSGRTNSRGWIHHRDLVILSKCKD